MQSLLPLAPETLKFECKTETLHMKKNIDWLENDAISRALHPNYPSLQENLSLAQVLTS